MHNYRPITTRKLFTDEAILASGTVDSVTVDLREISGNGIFSLHYITSGTGTTKFEYLLASEKDGNYVNIGTDIGATLVAGESFLPVTPEMAPFIKIRATEDGGVNSVTVNAWLNVQ